MKRPKVGVCTFIRKRDMILMGLRKGRHATHFWGLPGGHMEARESFEQCAIREVAEETGILLPAVELWTFENVVYHLDDRHYVTFFMRADLPPGQEVRLMEPDKVEHWGWFPWRTLPEPLMLGTQQLIAKGRNPWD